MTIKKILNELADFSPILFYGDETHEVSYFANPWLSSYDREAVYIAVDQCVCNNAFKNAGTLIVSENMLSFISSVDVNVIIVELNNIEEVKNRLQMLLNN